MELDEIKVNNFYSTRLISEYKEGENGDSTPIINKRVIRTAELINKLKNTITIDPEKKYVVDHLFPPNCRYYEHHKEGHLVVIEEPPAFRTIAVDKDMANEIESLRSSKKLEEYGYENWLAENSKKPYMFNLAIPYAVFCLAFTKSFEPLGGKFFFRVQPISGFSDPLCKAPLLNISDDQSVCFGDRAYKGPHKSIFSDVNHVISTFWSTIFNPDYIYNYLAYQEVAGLCDYLTWEYYSHSDPMFIYNADWIKYDSTIGSTINTVRDWIFSSNRNRVPEELNYNTLAELFTSQTEKGLEKVPGVDVEEPLIYDVCQYIYVGDLPLFIGDSIKSKNDQSLYVDSFLGFRKVSQPVYVNIQREDGRLFRMRLTNKVKEYIEEKLKQERYETEVKIPNGITLKAGDILVMKNIYDHDVYRKINYLRKNVDGTLEGSFGGEFYIIENLPSNVSVLDISKPEYMGIKLEVNKEFFVLRGCSSVSPIIQVSFADFKEIIPGNRTSLMMKFTESKGDNRGYNYSINYTNTDELKVFDVENARKLPPVFRMGRKLMYARNRGRQHPGPDRAYVISEIGAVGTPHSVSLRQASYDQWKEKFIKDDVFKVEAHDLDLEFKIGEKVVVANWQNPIDMLTVKQIEGFVENTESGTISFALSDKNNNLSSHTYISHGAIKVGSIRKITNKWQDLAAGMKITANKPGVSMFPKKDTNIIIGFLYDTGGPEPLVLCSNACTLWYSDVIEKFNITTMKNKKWKQLKHAPINPSKMRIQNGDLINGLRSYKTDAGYIAYIPNNSRTIRALQLAYFTDYEEGYPFDSRFTKDVQFDSFPNPRLTASQETKLGFMNGFPNFHGMYTATSQYFSQYLFTNDPRSILNVSNNSE